MMPPQEDQTYHSGWQPEQTPPGQQDQRLRLPTVPLARRQRSSALKQESESQSHLPIQHTRARAMHHNLNRDSTINPLLGHSR